MRIRVRSRFELKYLLTGEQSRTLLEALSAYLEPDGLGGQHGCYTITSLYYDSPDYKAYWDKIEGHRFRRKVRIRVYGNGTVTPNTRCFVEIKQRINKTVQKKRIVLPYSAATALCEGAGDNGIVNAEMSEMDREVVKEIRYLQGVLQLQPACVVKYNRVAFEGHEYDEGLRVTFDTDLKSRVHDLTLLSQNYVENHFFLPPELCIMEIKVNHRVPYWLIELIGRYGCHLRRVSKYCAALEQSKVLLQRQKVVY